MKPACFSVPVIAVMQMGDVIKAIDALAEQADEVGDDVVVPALEFFTLLRKLDQLKDQIAKL